MYKFGSWRVSLQPNVPFDRRIFMTERKQLRNLKVSDFIHSRELELQSGVINSPEVQKLINMVSDVNLKINKTRIQGTYVQLYPQTAPKVFAVLEDVCRDYGQDMTDVLLSYETVNFNVCD